MRRLMILIMVGLTAAGVLAIRSTGASAAVQADLTSLRLTVVAPDPLFFGGPTSLEYDRTNLSDAGGYARTDEILLDVGGGTGRTSFGLDLHAPSGGALTVGSYAGNDSYGGPAGYGTLDWASSSCADVAFSIVDLAVSGRSITRLDLRFHAECQTSITGELQLGEPAAAPGLLAGVRDFSWPVVPVNTVARETLPIWLRNTGATSTTLGQVRIGGANAHDFGVLEDHCSSVRLAAGGGCAIRVSFTPHGAGTRVGSVTVALGASSVQLELSGAGPLGRTLLSVTSRPGDFVGQGRSVLVTDAQHQFSVGRADASWFTAGTQDGVYDWAVFIATPDGRPLTPGSYVTNDDNDHPGYTLSVTGDGRGCGAERGSVTIKQAAFAVDGTPLQFDATFQQTCTDSSAGLSGEIAFRATDTPIAASAPFVLRSGQSLASGKQIRNADGSGVGYRLSVRSDGRAIVSSDAGSTLWSTPTSGSGTADRLSVLADGTLALTTSAGKTVWQVRPAGARAGDFLQLQTDGNLVLYDPGYVPLWSTGTAQPVS